MIDDSKTSQNVTVEKTINADSTNTGHVVREKLFTEGKNCLVLILI